MIGTPSASVVQQYAFACMLCGTGEVLEFWQLGKCVRYEHGVLEGIVQCSRAWLLFLLIITLKPES